MSDSRLDTALVDRGLLRSRTAAARAIAAGDVRVDGVVVTRPAVRVTDDAALEVGGVQYVSRAAHKLEAALDAFALDPSGRLALDLGASTGGFTALLLARGARRVIALDVGHDQLAPEVREDPRVAVVEGENARDLTVARLAELTGTHERPSLIVADLSFISLAHVLPAIAAVLAQDGDVVCLVKPQFEVGRQRVRGGLVPDPSDRVDGIRAALEAAAAAGLGTVGLIPSPISGTHGNREALAHLRQALGSDPGGWEDRIRVAAGAVEGGDRGR